jgi:hypothetical protein
LYRVLGTLISWMSGSANSPINVDEAKTLLERLEERPAPPTLTGEATKEQR